MPINYLIDDITKNRSVVVLKVAKVLCFFGQYLGQVHDFGTTVLGKICIVG
jgi:hypothetical protein